MIKNIRKINLKTSVITNTDYLNSETDLYRKRNLAV